jgi:hypothetical protein
VGEARSNLPRPHDQPTDEQRSPSPATAPARGPSCDRGAVCVPDVARGPAAALTQELDPFAAAEQSLAGGVAVPAGVEVSLQDTVEAGGAPAVPETLPEPMPAPAPSAESPPTPSADVAPEPQFDAPSVPDPGVLSETAPVPAPESPPSDVPEEADLTTPAIPGNINVDIRILSPGDNGDVTQDVTLLGWSGQDGGAAEGQPLDLEWNWNWTWIWIWAPPLSGSDEIPGIGADDIPGMGGGLLEGVLDDAPGLPFGEAPADEAAGMLPVEAEPVTSGDLPPPAPRDRAAVAGAERHSPLEPYSSLTVTGDTRDTGGAASVAPAVARATHGRRQLNRGHTPAPEQAPTVLPSAAASSLSGGSSAPLAAALLGLLCLLAPRARARTRPGPKAHFSAQLIEA